jgi:hypothetical protein
MRASRGRRESACDDAFCWHCSARLLATGAFRAAQNSESHGRGPWITRSPFSFRPTSWDGARLKICSISVTLPARRPMDVSSKLTEFCPAMPRPPSEVIEPQHDAEWASAPASRNTSYRKVTRRATSEQTDSNGHPNGHKGESGDEHGARRRK